MGLFDFRLGVGNTSGSAWKAFGNSTDKAQVLLHDINSITQAQYRQKQNASLALGVSSDLACSVNIYFASCIRGHATSGHNMRYSV